MYVLSERYRITAAVPVTVTEESTAKFLFNLAGAPTQTLMPPVAWDDKCYYLRSAYRH
jgi:hypothetical protein